jgi:DNA-directed RNA polymerase subunit RPC12/RpoP
VNRLADKTYSFSGRALVTHFEKRSDKYICDNCGAEWEIGGPVSPGKERETVYCRWCGAVLFSGLTREGFSDWTLLKDGDPSLKKEA